MQRVIVIASITDMVITIVFLARFDCGTSCGRSGALLAELPLDHMPIASFVGAHALQPSRRSQGGDGPVDAALTCIEP